MARAPLRPRELGADAVVMRATPKETCDGHAVDVERSGYG